MSHQPTIPRTVLTLYPSARRARRKPWLTAKRKPQISNQWYGWLGFWYGWLVTLNLGVLGWGCKLFLFMCGGVEPVCSAYAQLFECCLSAPDLTLWLFSMVDHLCAGNESPHDLQRDAPLQCLCHGLHGTEDEEPEMVLTTEKELAPPQKGSYLAFPGDSGDSCCGTFKETAKHVPGNIDIEVKRSSKRLWLCLAKHRA